MRNVYLLLVSLAIINSSFAQQATNSTSGTGQAGSIIMDWSLGELTLVNTVQTGNLVFTQGLHQGKLIAFKAVAGSIADGELVVAPNPTTGLLTVQTGFLEAGQLTLKMYDAQGKLLMEDSQPVGSFGSRTLDMIPYASGLYMLHAYFTPTNGDARKRTYKILKL